MAFIVTEIPGASLTPHIAAGNKMKRSKGSKGSFALMKVFMREWDIFYKSVLRFVSLVSL